MRDDLITSQDSLRGGRPLRVLFVLTSMPVGGAETLLADLVLGLPRDQWEPEIVCLKGPGVLGETLSQQVPLHHGLIRNRWDAFVLFRLWKLFRQRDASAIVTVGCGDKMFWGRLAAWLAGVPVIASALHSTGWPDGVGTLNRWLSWLTDAFIAVAPSHGNFLVKHECFPREKVVVIPNGIDTDRFCPRETAHARLREELRLPKTSKVCTIVAAIRPEKNHERFLRVARAISDRDPAAHFLIVGDGPLRGHLENLAHEIGIGDRTHFLGNRTDTEWILAGSEIFLLTSDNEAYPVSILEAMACGVPVIASDVGSIHELVQEGKTGYRIGLQAEEQFAEKACELLREGEKRIQFGKQARIWAIEHGSRRSMICGYVRMLTVIYGRKTQQARRRWPHLLSLGFRRWAR